MPRTATRSPGCGAPQRSPDQTVYPAKKMGAACSKESPSGSGVVASAKASMYSAWPPGSCMLVPSDAPQNIGLPGKHHSHRPQDDCTQATPTRSPILRVVTPAPTATISPTGSWPSVRGKLPGILPCVWWTSV